MSDVAALRIWASGRHAGYFNSTLTCCSTTTGSVKVKVEPWPTCDSILILSACISMIRFDMASPESMPPFLRVIALSARGAAEILAAARTHQFHDLEAKRHLGKNPNH
jgi:hypothetical protein